MEKYESFFQYCKRKIKELKEKTESFKKVRSEKTEDEILKIKLRRKKQKYFILALTLMFFLFYFFFQPFRNLMTDFLETFSSLDVKDLVKNIRSYGKLAALISFSLMILQSVIAPLPAFLLKLANAAIFGAFYGALLSWISILTGAALCFFVARALGRDVVEKLTFTSSLENLDVFFEKYGKYAILIFRLFPFISFDFISYAAGLTNMPFWSFIISTAIGSLPSIIIYSYVGASVSGSPVHVFLGLLVLFVISALIVVFKHYYDERKIVNVEKTDENKE